TLRTLSIVEGKLSGAVCSDREIYPREMSGIGSGMHPEVTSTRTTTVNAMPSAGVPDLRVIIFLAFDYRRVIYGDLYLGAVAACRSVCIGHHHTRRVNSCRCVC